jgi:hypothetical protein
MRRIGLDGPHRAQRLRIWHRALRWLAWIFGGE